ncbi:MAG TPA: pyridoxamine 5'-phosphate oxidase family protein [Acidimicrobiales bacterium]|jgi:hypothetical protein|nr:pyridoxamine 5'-phosphate oxidase family protein [Acidimicrobiales bacterium]
MARWEEFASVEPELAGQVRQRFAAARHSTLATLRQDGSPRISGTEVEFADDGDVYLGMMPGSLKARDLRRDPRLALHSPTQEPSDADPTAWPGEAKLAGRAIEVFDQAVSDEAHRFRIDVTEVVLTVVAESGDHLVISSWHPDRGLVRRQRY